MNGAYGGSFCGISLGLRFLPVLFHQYVELGHVFVKTLLLFRKMECRFTETTDTDFACTDIGIIIGTKTVAA